MGDYFEITLFMALFINSKVEVCDGGSMINNLLSCTHHATGIIAIGGLLDSTGIKLFALFATSLAVLLFKILLRHV